MERRGVAWLIIVSVGFMMGFGVLTGTLGWIFSRRLKRRAAPARPPGVVRVAYFVSIITTVLSALGLMLAFGMVLVFSGFAL